MPVIEIPASALQPGDKLCTQLDRTEVSYESTLNAWRVYSKAFTLVWNHYGEDHHGFKFFMKHIRVIKPRVFVVSRIHNGVLKTRITTAMGASVKIPVNAPIAVFRKESE